MKKIASRSLWERATVTALVLGTAGWLTGGCGNETQEVTTNTLIPIGASPLTSIVPVGTVALSNAQVPTGTTRIVVRFTNAAGQSVDVAGTASANNTVITAQTPSGFAGNTNISVIYFNSANGVIGTQATTANIQANTTTAAALANFVAASPTPTPTPSASATPTPTPSPSATPRPPITGLSGNITISGGTFIVIGATSQLTANGNVSGTNTNISNNVTWASSNATVANVSQTGQITGLAAGSTNITATASNGTSNITGTATVTVAPTPPPAPPSDSN